MVQSPVKGRKLSVRAPLTGHISKGIWVSQGIAGWELCVSGRISAMIKKIIIISCVLGFAGFQIAGATSGACSSHGGVNCLASSIGNTVCNDGSMGSSVDFVNACQAPSQNFCFPPIAGMCTTQADLGRLETQGYQNGAAEYNPDYSGTIAACQSAIISYQAQELTYETCLSTQSSYQPSTPITATAGTFQLLNFATSVEAVVGQVYSAYFNFLYSGIGVPHVSLVGQNVPSGMQLGAVNYGINGVDSIQYGGVPRTIMDYPMTLELTDNSGTLFTRQYDFDVVQALPLDAYAVTTSTWTCDDGYINNGIGCQLPPNGSLVGGKLVCNAGYVNYNGSCSLASDLANNLCWTYTQYNKGDGSSLGSFSTDGTLTCNCPPGDVWNGKMNRCDTASASVTITPATITPITNVNQLTATTTIPSFASVTQNLQLGASGQNVINLQKFLEAKGFLAMPTGTTEGYFGGLTKQALTTFQKANGLPATGYCGPMTRSVISN